jgi:hypothetical protein
MKKVTEEAVFVVASEQGNVLYSRVHTVELCADNPFASSDIDQSQCSAGKSFERNNEGAVGGGGTGRCEEEMSLCSAVCPMKLSRFAISLSTLGKSKLPFHFNFTVGGSSRTTNKHNTSSSSSSSATCSARGDIMFVCCPLRLSNNQYIYFLLGSPADCATDRLGPFVQAVKTNLTVFVHTMVDTIGEKLLVQAANQLEGIAKQAIQNSTFSDLLFSPTSQPATSVRKVRLDDDEEFDNDEEDYVAEVMSKLAQLDDIFIVPAMERCLQSHGGSIFEFWGAGMTAFLSNQVHRDAASQARISFYVSAAASSSCTGEKEALMHLSSLTVSSDTTNSISSGSGHVGWSLRPGMLSLSHDIVSCMLAKYRSQRKDAQATVLLVRGANKRYSSNSSFVVFEAALGKHAAALATVVVIDLPTSTSENKNIVTQNIERFLPLDDKNVDMFVDDVTSSFEEGDLTHPVLSGVQQYLQQLKRTANFSANLRSALHKEVEEVDQSSRFKTPAAGTRRLNATNKFTSTNTDKNNNLQLQDMFNSIFCLEKSGQWEDKDTAESSDGKMLAPRPPSAPRRLLQDSQAVEESLQTPETLKTPETPQIIPAVSNVVVNSSVRPGRQYVIK